MKSLRLASQSIRFLNRAYEPLSRRNPKAQVTPVRAAKLYSFTSEGRGCKVQDLWLVKASYTCDLLQLLS